MTARTDQDMPAWVFDDTSVAIIGELQRDGRRSCAAIAKAVGLSESAIRFRIDRMVDSGAVQIVAVTNPMEMGFARQAMIGVKCHGDAAVVAEQLAAIESVAFVVLTSGSFDAIAEVVCENDDDLLQLMNRCVRAVPGVISIETMVYLKLVKQEHSRIPGGGAESRSAAGRR